MSPATPSTTAATVHRIVIHPLDRYGSYRVTDRETAQEWIAKTRFPACAAARVLRDCGANPSDRLEMFREGRDRPDLAGSLGWFADRTVSEGDRHGPTFRPFREFPKDRVTVTA